MAIKLCHHIKEGGIFCGSAALRGRDYCHFHLTWRGRRERIARHRRRNQPWRIELPPLENLNAVQAGIMQVLDAICEGRLERRDAGHLLYGLQNAACNLRGRDHASFEVKPEAENRCVAYDSFEEDYGLMDEDSTGGQEGYASTAAPPATTAPAAVGTDENMADAIGSPPIGRNNGEEGATATEETPADRAADPAPSGIAAARARFAESQAGPVPDTAKVEALAKKLPRGLCPPQAQRQSTEEAEMMAQQWMPGDEGGRLLNGEIVNCRLCPNHMYKQMAQFWEGDDQPADWLPQSGVTNCGDCRTRTGAALRTNRDRLCSHPTCLFMVLKTDGGKDPGDFEDFLGKWSDFCCDTGDFAADWHTRWGAVENLGIGLADEALSYFGDADEDEEDEASA